MVAAVPTAAAEEGSQLSKFRKLSLALCSEQRRARRGTQRVGGAVAAASRSSVGSGSLTSTGRDGRPVRKQPLLPSLAFLFFSSFFLELKSIPHSLGLLTFTL